MAYLVKEYTNQFHVVKDDFHFKWQVDGFNEIPFIFNHPVISPSIFFRSCNEFAWHLLMSKELKPKRNAKVKDEKERTLGFKLIKTDDFSTWDFVTYHVALKIGDMTFKTEESTRYGDEECDTSTFLYESDLVGIDFDKAETIHIEVFGEYKFIEQDPLEPIDSACEKQFAEDLWRLYCSQKHADVVLIAGKAEILAHKSVLFAGGCGFDDHFQVDQELAQKKLDLDLDETVAKALLTFIYCGGIPVEFPPYKCSVLCAAAKKYELGGLKPVVLDFLKKLHPEFCTKCLCDNEGDTVLVLADAELKRIFAKEKCTHKICQS